MEALMTAYRQWAERPADERFWTMEDMRNACHGYYRRAAEARVNVDELRVEARGDDLRLLGKNGAPAQLSHYAFGQLCSRARAPASYLRELPATLTAQNLNNGLKRTEPGMGANLLFHRHEDDLGLTVRAALSGRYERVWNWEFVDKLQDVLGGSWRPPPGRPAPSGDARARPATEEDCLKRRNTVLAIHPGTMIGPSGLYASDRDMFAFLVDEENVISDGTDDGLVRGLMFWNSEVGDKKIGGLAFLFKAVCGNHIVMGVNNLLQWGTVHVGRAREKAWLQLDVMARSYAQSSVSTEAGQIGAARTMELGKDKEATVKRMADYAARRRIGGVSKERLEDAYDRAEEHEHWYGTTPNTVWGMVQGYTEAAAANSKHADVRVQQERVAGKLMEIAF